MIIFCLDSVIETRSIMWIISKIWYLKKLQIPMGSIKNYVQIKKKLNLFTCEDEYSHIYRYDKF